MRVQIATTLLIRGMGMVLTLKPPISWRFLPG